MSLGDRPIVVLTVALSLLGVLAIGVAAGRRTRDARDFFIAGQRLGPVVTALATMSAAFSGFVFLGGPGLTYRLGVASLFVVLPVGFTAGLLCWGVGRELRRLADDADVMTVPDAFRVRYGSPAVGGLAALAVAVGSVAYLGLQFQAMALLLRAVFDLRSPWLAMALGAGVVLAYGVVGGMVAGVYTDVAQGGLMLVTAVAVFVRALTVNGGWSAMLESIAGSPEFGRAFLEPFGRAPAFTAFGFFFVFGVGVLGQPQMLHKFYMLRDPAALRFMPALLGGSQAVCLLIWLGLGLAVPALVAGGRLPAPAVADEAATAFLLGPTPGWLAGLAFAGIVAASMSTADSFVNIGSAALVRDLPRALGRRLRRELAWGRGAVALLAVAAALCAQAFGGLIALLGTFAFGTFAAALAPALAVGLHWRRVGPGAAAASIVTGLVANVGFELAARYDAWSALGVRGPAEGLPPAALALAASFAVLFLATAFGGRAVARPDAQ